jgi:hypothetical protein
MTKEQKNLHYEALEAEDRRDYPLREKIALKLLKHPVVFVGIYEINTFDTLSNLYSSILFKHSKSKPRALGSAVHVYGEVNKDKEDAAVAHFHLIGKAVELNGGNL